MVKEATKGYFMSDQPKVTNSDCSLSIKVIFARFVNKTKKQLVQVCIVILKKKQNQKTKMLHLI